MTRRFAEPEVRQLYEWWRRGDISLREAARSLRCEPRTLQARFAKLGDAYCREIIDRRRASAAIAKQRRVEKATRLWTNASVVMKASSGYRHGTPCNLMAGARSA